MDTASALTFLQEQEQSRQSVLVKVGSRVFFTNDKSKQRIHKPDKPASDEKWAAIKAYRKANGLFYICGEKWGHGHKCPPNVPLKVIQEIMEIFQLDDTPDSKADDQAQSVSDEVILIVQSTVVGNSQQKKGNTIRFRGCIGKQELLIHYNTNLI